MAKLTAKYCPPTEDRYPYWIILRGTILEAEIVDQDDRGRVVIINHRSKTPGSRLISCESLIQAFALFEDLEIEYAPRKEESHSS